MTLRDSQGKIHCQGIQPIHRGPHQADTRSTTAKYIPENSENITSTVRVTSVPIHIMWHLISVFEYHHRGRHCTATSRSVSISTSMFFLSYSLHCTDYVLHRRCGKKIYMQRFRVWLTSEKVRQMRKNNIMIPAYVDELAHSKIIKRYNIPSDATSTIFLPQPFHRSYISTTSSLFGTTYLQTYQRRHHNLPRTFILLQHAEAHGPQRQ